MSLRSHIPSLCMKPQTVNLSVDNDARGSAATEGPKRV